MTTPKQIDDRAAFNDFRKALERLASFTLPKGEFPKGEDDADDNAETLAAIINEARALTGIEGPDQCDQCGNVPEDAGDGWDGKCETCADRDPTPYETDSEENLPRDAHERATESTKYKR